MNRQPLNSSKIERSFLSNIASIKERMKAEAPLTKDQEAWISVQRYLNKQGYLNPKKVALLKRNGISLNQITEDTWTMQFKAYKKLKERDPDFKPKKRVIYSVYIESHEVRINLTGWLDQQRSQYKKGTLSKDRVDALNSINFQWVVDAPHNKVDYKKYCSTTLSFIKSKGRFPKRQETYQGKEIGKWFHNLKFFLRTNERYKHLSKEKIQSVKPLINLLRKQS